MEQPLRGEDWDKRVISQKEIDYIVKNAEFKKSTEGVLQNHTQILDNHSLQINDMRKEIRDTLKDTKKEIVDAINGVPKRVSSLEGKVSVLLGLLYGTGALGILSAGVWGVIKWIGKT